MASSSSSIQPKSPTFSIPAQLESMYYPEVEQLIKRESGAARVVIFDHTLRSGDEAEREAKLIREPVCQRTTITPNGRDRTACASFLPDEAEDATHPPLRDHSGLARDQPTDPNESSGAGRRQECGDGRPGRRRAPLSAPGRPNLSVEIQPRTSLVLFPRNAAATKRWFSKFTILKRMAAPASRRTPPSTIQPPPGAPARQSIEVRAFAFFN